jgi:hypothetical protein
MNPGPEKNRLDKFENVRLDEAIMYSDIGDWIFCKKSCANMAVTEDGTHIEIDPDYLVWRKI